MKVKEKGIEILYIIRLSIVKYGSSASIAP